MNISRATNKFSRGLSLLEVLLVVMIIVAIFVMPIHLVYKKEKAHADRVRCINNLKQVGLSSILWERDHGDKFPDKFPWEIAQTNGGTMEFTSGPNLWRHFQVMSNELSTPSILVCPADDSSVAATNFTHFNNANISYFIALEGTQSAPDSLVSGDRNITNGTSIEHGILNLTPNHAAGWTKEMHRLIGLTVTADGSAALLSTPQLRDHVSRGVDTTNRLLMPVREP